MINFIKNKNWLNDASLFLLVTSFTNTVFSFLILKILSFSFFIFPLFIFSTFIMISLGALTIKKFQKSQKKILIFNLQYIYLITTFCLFFILSNTEIVNRAGNINFFNITKFVFLSVLLLFPFYFYWGKIEYYAYQLFIEDSRNPNLFYAVNLMGFLSGIVYDFCIFRHVGIVGTIVLLLIMIVTYYDYKFKKLFIIILCFMFYLGFKYEHKIITYFLSDKDSYNIKNNAYFIDQFLHSDSHKYRKKYEILNQSWNTHCHYSLIKYKNYIFGAYNGSPYWYYQNDIKISNSSESLENLPFKFLNKGFKAAIIGVGGGLQVSLALNHNPEIVYAIEVVENVIDDLKLKFSEHNNNIFNNKKVVPIKQEGSNFIKNSDVQFDLIMSANTESFVGLIKDMFESSYLFHTYESFCEIYKKLNDNGILTIKKSIYITDENDEIFFNYFYTMQKAGFIVRGYIDHKEHSFLLLGFKKHIPDTDRIKEIEKDFQISGIEIMNTIPPLKKVNLIDYDNLYLGGVFYYLCGKNVFIKSYLTLLILLTLCLLFFSYRFKNTDGNSIKIKSFLIGGNFILVQSLIINKLRFIVSNPLDAYYYGLLIFTLTAILGNIATDDNSKINKNVILCIFCSSILISIHIVFILPMIFFTGIFFKKIFILYPEKRLEIFSYDLLGMMFGGIVNFSLMYSVDYSFMILTTLVVFIITFLSLRNQIIK